jgi:iron complex outermembrane receptor protein
LPATIPSETLAQDQTLPKVVVTAPAVGDASSTAVAVGNEQLAPQRNATSDSARLLQDIPGVSLYGAGGVSSLPVVHGLADDRVRTQVDGMDLVAACPNHMNSALSYIDPANVGKVTVYAGIAPVSAGGDSIGGTIQVDSAPPTFATPGAFLAKGQSGASYRSNGIAKGGNLGAALATDAVNLAYNGATADQNNYRAARAFKSARAGTEGGDPIPGDVVASSAYAAVNQDVGVAFRHDRHLLQLKVGQQHIRFEGFPNQRMDMTDNKGTQVNLRYNGQYEWGELIARAYQQKVEHEMDMGPDRYTYGTGMPMLTEATTRGALLQGNVDLSDAHTLRLGTEAQTYTLYDWWPAVGGAMGPNDFWNIDYGRRNKADLFAEWERRWTPEWLGLAGVRGTRVTTDAAPVQGYDNGLAGIWGNDAAAFNARQHKRTDNNWDMTLLARNVPDPTAAYEGGYARKSRSPNLYQRYPWSTNAMAALMNNFVGDGNGYIGNPDLKPEVAHTLSATADWHDARNERRGLKATLYYTRVEDYIDARRCTFGQCVSAPGKDFLLLQYVNETARLYGLDLSGHARLLRTEGFGTFTGTLLVNYVRGENLTSGDNLYNIMPLNAKFGLVHRAGGWSSTAELLAVSAKKRLAEERKEMATPGYALLNVRTSYQTKYARLDLGVENVFDRLYFTPLGGAYVGQGPSMGTSTIAWGQTVPGPGRSINAAINLNY